MHTNPYESEDVLSQYLLFHYGKPHEVMPWPLGPKEALNFPVRIVNECIHLGLVNQTSRVLDLGCSVGRSTFEFSRYTADVRGVDLSQSFIGAAQQIQRDHELRYYFKTEGFLNASAVAKMPDGANAERVQFEVGNAVDLSQKLGTFDLVLAANLIDRLGDPAVFLQRMRSVVRTGGHLVLCSPYTWMPEFTDPAFWLGGYLKSGAPVKTIDALHRMMKPEFHLMHEKDIPFLIREHARKFQWSVSHFTVWKKAM